ncbi:MAG: alanine/ornithine racemase family PLP-dependent enzyme [Clostridiales bacterium]|jgi:predicted amino acid racemase|nr:alanine/ornithine racemase family PLP-dependent enzyme [Clostridiales bacterium]
MYPKIEISQSKLKHNSKTMCDLFTPRGVSIMGVTKCFCAIPEAAQAMVDGGISMLADSRINNLKRLAEIPVKKVLLRLPMHNEIEDVVRYADYSLNSELSTLKLLGKAAVSLGKVHNIIIMVDLGDLREGVWAEDIDKFTSEAVRISGIKIKGFGANLTCYGGVIPDETNLGNLVKISEKMKEKYNLEIEIVSGGNSSSVYLMSENRFPSGINNLRLGEILLLGRETAYGKVVNGMHRDTFTLKAEIIELKDKPSVPIGNIGMDAFGNIPSHEDRGIIRRGIIAVGRQDIDPDGLFPTDNKIDILGASSDHTILDVTNSSSEYKVGDIVEFHMDYSCLLRASTSEYVDKIMVD